MILGARDQFPYSETPIVLRTTGPANLITDVEGILVGNAEHERLRSGTTVVVAERPAVCGIDIRGGATGTVDVDLLRPVQTVQRIDAVTLSGGSAFGLGAVSGVVDALALDGRGFEVGPARVPIVPGAILFDLLNGGDKDWGKDSPYRKLGAAAYRNAGKSFAIGSVGAGTGATTAGLKGGLGSASCRLAKGFTVGALVAVNALGSTTLGTTPHFRAAPFEIGNEFGGLGLPSRLPPDAAAVHVKGVLRADLPANTTIAVIATDADLTKAEATRLAIMAQTGMAQAIWPTHTPLDGDIVFAMATGMRPLGDTVQDMIELGAAAAATLARAIARGVYAAQPCPGDLLPCWREYHEQTSRLRDE